MVRVIYSALIIGSFVAFPGVHPVPLAASGWYSREDFIVTEKTFIVISFPHTDRHRRAY